jgi:O-acetyl-ADP-ribose deacetylase (regulator of RNase III)
VPKSDELEPLRPKRILLGGLLCIAGALGGLVVAVMARLLHAVAVTGSTPDSYEIEQFIDWTGPFVVPVALAISLYLVIQWAARNTAERGGRVGGAIAIIACFPAFSLIGDPGILKLIAYFGLITFGYWFGDVAGRLPPPADRSAEWAEMLHRIQIVQGDITRQKSDVIVNPANPTLLGGSGVDGHIHTAAGPDLLTECRNLNGCEVGGAKLTKGYKLPAKWVVHIVAPTWHEGNEEEEYMLAACYRSAIDLAVAKDATSIAFSSSTGATYSFPIDRAAPIVLRTIATALTEMEVFSVVIVCTDFDSLTAYRKTLSNLRVPVVKQVDTPQKLAA